MTIKKETSQICKHEDASAPEYKDLKKLIDGSLYSLILLTAFAIYIGIVSHSLTIVVVAIEGFLSISMHIFNFISIRSIIRQNVFKFPLGAGKLENLSGFFLGALFIPLAGYFFYGAVARALRPPLSINFGLAQIPIILWLIRSTWLLLWVRRLIRKYTDYSPMTRAYHVNMKVTLFVDVFIMCGMMLGAIVMSTGRDALATAIDLGLSVMIALYMLIGGIQLVKGNFSSLIDLPLPEDDQLKILKALVPDYHSFANIGNIYSQLSGGRRIIQIELFFNDKMTVKEVDALRGRVEERLKNDFSRMMFHLIPRLNEDFESPGTFLGKTTQAPLR